MIQDWRNRWGQGDFPFLFVQLANFKSNPYWPVLRESQTETLRLANTGMAVIIDIGESKRHPSEEQAGRGTAPGAGGARVTYKQPVEYSGPMFQIGDAGERRDARLPHARRRHAGARRQARSRASRSPAPTASTSPADAKVDGNTLLVSSAQVAESRGGALRVGRRSGVQSGESGGPAGEPVPQRSAALSVGGY